VRGATHYFIFAFQPNSVSIHAPVRGATVRYKEFLQSHYGFNPRARAGRDCSWRPPSRPLLSFQSTRPCGARPLGLDYPLYIDRVSIHAPVRGATVVGLLVTYSGASFNPRARAGRDVFGSHAIKVIFRFQSTRPCGARRSTFTWTTRGTYCFNPRARAGRDVNL